MNDLISRKALIAEYDRVHIGPPGVARKLMEDAPAVQQWISVKDRLPEDDLPKGSKVKQIKVLTALKGSNGVRIVRSQMRYRMTWYNSSPWAWKCSGSEVTYWMPLPQPPKDDKLDKLAETGIKLGLLKEVE